MCILIWLLQWPGKLEHCKGFPRSWRVMSSIHDANDIASLTKYLTTTLLICLYNVSENEWFLPKRCIFSQFNSKLMIMIKVERVGVRPWGNNLKGKVKLVYATCTPRIYSRYLLFEVEVLRLTDLRWQKKKS